MISIADSISNQTATHVNPSSHKSRIVNVGLNKSTIVRHVATTVDNTAWKARYSDNVTYRFPAQSKEVKSSQFISKHTALARGKINKPVTE